MLLNGYGIWNYSAGNIYFSLAIYMKHGIVPVDCFSEAPACVNKLAN